ncbi:hypothetical protein PHLGIDRAFT_36159 [Phlebiopsis gigantea 11061_1 CR5-6]|uniref:F-box domain-containing protein n=1 Tax=Phlebiopsis gigantea (strain 11061_1 CR5-6) TaxID=745531 RepID=A0A0C3S669_PHLG1|nr:hypothetical protein PHLGIDRAFT_36159 [Phlebiopsis gigantea 11061_1 CR5-6]
MPPARKAKRKRAQTYDSPPSSEDENYKPEDEKYQPEPAVKKVKRTRGKRGNLANFLSMPLDVVYEVLLCLDPMDLLNLARTSKDFRRLLMSQNSAHVWKTVIQDADDIPDCPADLSPPSFVHLLYQSICHNCGRGPCEKIYWECRARYCNRCKTQISIDYNYRYNSDKDYSIRNNLQVPNVSLPFTYLPVYALVPLMLEGPFKLGNLPKLKELLVRRADLEAVQRELSELKSEDEIYAYIKQRTIELEKAREQTEDLVDWRENKVQFRIKNNKRLQAERLKGIEDKLIDLGYEPYIQQIMSMTAFKTHPMVIQAKALTDRIWNNIEDTIIGIAEPVKQAVLRREKEQTIVARLHVLDEALVKIRLRKRNDASLRDIALFIPEVKGVLTLPNDQAVTTADFDFLRTALPEFEEKRKKDAREYLCGQAKKDLGIDVEDPLALAVGSVFACGACRRLCSWPHILAHSCTTRCQTPSNADHYVNIIVDNTPRMTWAASKYRVPEKLKALIEAYGLDPLTATVEEMDQCPLEHHLSSGCQPANWKVVDDAQTEAARPLEAFARGMGTDRLWTCARCPRMEQRLVSRHELEEHMSTKHNLAKPTDEDFVYDSPLSETGATNVRLLDEKEKGQWRVDRYKSNTAAYFPLT